MIHMFGAKGTKKSNTAFPKYHNNTLNFLPYLSAMTPVGSSNTNQMILLKLQIKAIAARDMLRSMK